MEKAELEALVQSLEQRARRLERRQSGIVAGIALGVVVLFASGWHSVREPSDTVKTRAVSIVDKNGVARIVLGAPVPNPAVNGKAEERRSPANGIAFNDANGNERGGIGMLDDGSMNLCFDDAKTERNCLFLSPKLGNGLVLNDGNGNGRALIYLDQTSNPHLMLVDDHGRPLVSLPEESKAK